MAEHRTETSDETVRAGGPGRLVAAVLGITVLVTMMFMAFGAPAVHSGAHELPIGVSGPDAAVTPLVAALDEQAPDGFAVTRYADGDAVVAAIRDRDEVGGIEVGPDGVVVHVASGAGAPYAQALRGIGAGIAAQGQTVSYEDAAPLTDDDPAGSGLTAMALPLIVGGMISAVVLSTLLKGASAWLRPVASVSFAVLAGLAITSVLQLVLGTTDGDFWPLAGATALAVGAISLTVLGLESLLGPAGLGLGAVTMLFVANPISGFATGPQWLPAPWGEVGQYLPVGAGGTALRSFAFFDGGGAAHALVVLAAWAAFGLLLSVLGGVRSARRRSAG